MNATIAVVITAALLAKAKAADGVEAITKKLNKPNFMGRVQAVAAALSQFGVTLEAVAALKGWKWFSDDSSEQLVDWLNEIVTDLKANGVAGIPAECFAALDDLGAVPAGDADDDDIPSASDLEADFNEPPADK